MLLFAAVCLSAGFAAGDWNRRNSATTLGFDEALAITTDPSQEVEARFSALGRLRSIGIVSTHAMQNIYHSAEEELLRTHAAIYLDELRHELR